MKPVVLCGTSGVGKTALAAGATGDPGTLPMPAQRPAFDMPVPSAVASVLADTGSCF